MSVTEKLGQLSAGVKALLLVAAFVGGVFTVVAVINGVLGAPAKVEAVGAHVEGHHDTLQTTLPLLIEIDQDIHLIRDELREYRDSTIAMRARRACREDPESCR